ncbi:phage tail protein [Clostridium sp.]|uniref:phage tail-collar fiber domain-containing protein n=1 Tax=Clostridium sp. TaxID=1506 RepID=UPI00261E7174|nr:phage tail protein [Clostridium sp.]
MAEQFYTILTNTGKAKIANSLPTGTKVNLTTLKVGDSNGTYYNPSETQTDLVHTVYTCNVTSVAVDETNGSWINITGVIPSDQGGFTIREVGVFDDGGNLIAIGKYPETYKPTASDGSTKELYLKMTLEVSNSTSVTLKIDPTVILATKSDINTLTTSMNNSIGSINTQLSEIVPNTTLWYLENIDDMRTRSIVSVQGFYDIDENISNNYRILMIDGTETWTTITVGSNSFKISDNGEIAQNKTLTTSDKKLKYIARHGNVYIDMFGAIGDGTTNDTTVIQKAFNSAKNGDIINFNGEKTYFIECDRAWNYHANSVDYGFLNLSLELLNKTNIIIDGNNANLILKQVRTDGTFSPALKITNCNTVEVKNLNINCQRVEIGNTTGDMGQPTAYMYNIGIAIVNSENITVERNKIVNAFCDILMFTHVKNVRIRDNLLTQEGNYLNYYGILAQDIDNSSNIYVHNNVIDTCKGDAIEFDCNSEHVPMTILPKYIYIYKNIIKNVTITDGNTGISIGMASCTYFTIENNYVENVSEGIHIETNHSLNAINTTNNFKVLNNTLFNVTGGNRSAIYMTSGNSNYASDFKNVEIDSNVINNVNAWGIYGTYGKFTDLIVSKNNIEGCGYSGIAFTDVNNIRIINNHCKNNGSLGTDDYNGDDMCINTLYESAIITGNENKTIKGISIFIHQLNTNQSNIKYSDNICMGSLYVNSLATTISQT